ncbi:MAG: hypothetical protein B7Z37_24045 [Verrucomicrobia bacterium 12-59-8]|nr:MAG: hypothetical protein B7Z37_24045 [Verrucomicrobia bacterium 12-59-8]
MAGRPQRKETDSDLNAEILALKAQILDLKQKLAIADPNSASTLQPPEITAYSDQIPKQILALGELGLTENEMIAAMNVSRENWNEFKGSFPEMAAALMRARDMALAVIDRMSRESLANRDWRFPFQNVEKTKKVLMEQGGTDGDGASIVRVIKGAHPSSTTSNRPALCPRCAADTAGSADQADQVRGSE